MEIANGRWLARQCLLARLGALAITALLAVPPMSMAAIRNPDGVAVIIGNKTYTSRIPAVEFAHRDADAFKRFVIEVLGYDAANIIDLRDATKGRLESAFGNPTDHRGRLWRFLDPDGVSDVVVFYSGHGVPGVRDKRGYLLPADADPDTPEINGYSVDLLYRNLARLKSRSVTVYLDACFSGESQKGMLIRAASGISVKPRMPTAASGLTVLTAARGDQVASWDEKARHGLFTHHLLNALYGAADRGASGNGDGAVTLGEVQEHLNRHMTRAARRTYGRIQNPTVTGDKNKVLSSLADYDRAQGPPSDFIPGSSAIASRRKAPVPVAGNSDVGKSIVAPPGENVAHTTNPAEWTGTWKGEENDWVIELTVSGSKIGGEVKKISKDALWSGRNSSPIRGTLELDGSVEAWTVGFSVAKRKIYGKLPTLEMWDNGNWGGASFTLKKVSN